MNALPVDARHVVAVAFSGGRDSSALLHATCAAVRDLPEVAVVALHVHHGLSAQADAWQAHCLNACTELGIALHTERLAAAPRRGESTEAWARAQRYAALRRLALEAGAALVLLAHHRRDQAETFVLQALRGAGVAGISAMPRAALRHGVTWVRPWLHVPRERVEAYIAVHRIAFVDDETNADHRFARNRLRHAVWPALTRAFPHAEGTLAHAAVWAQHAAACLDELAALDLAALDAASPEGCTALSVAWWLGLSPARRCNALRAWLKRATGRPPPATLVERLMVELAAQRDDRLSARWLYDGQALERHRGLLRLVAAPVGEVGHVRETSLSIQRAGCILLPGWRAALHVERVAEGGLPLSRLAKVDLMPRAGGERFQVAQGRPPRSLKKQFQGAGVPAQQRGVPLFFCDGELVFVPRLGVDARALAAAGQVQMALRWVPNGEPARDPVGRAEVAE